MSESVVDSKLWTLGRTCSVGELQRLAKKKFREEDRWGDDNWLGQ